MGLNGIASEGERNPLISLVTPTGLEPVFSP